MTSVIRFLHSPKLLSGFANLTQVVKQGGTALPQGGVTEPELAEWVTFAESMTPIMHPAAEFIAELGRRYSQPMAFLSLTNGYR